MIGSGVDGLPQNMAASSALAPLLSAWLIGNIAAKDETLTF